MERREEGKQIMQFVMEFIGQRDYKCTLIKFPLLLLSNIEYENLIKMNGGGENREMKNGKI